MDNVYFICEWKIKVVKRVKDFDLFTYHVGLRQRSSLPKFTLKKKYFFTIYFNLSSTFLERSSMHEILQKT